MAKFITNNVRNVCVIGHSGSGKTATIESMLWKAGATDRLGRVADGNTVLDYDAEEKKRKEAAVVLCNVIIVPSDASDGVMLEGIRQQASGKDVARSEGRIIVGPFSSKAQAAALVEFVEVMGYGDATIENTER